GQPGLAAVQLDVAGRNVADGRVAIGAGRGIGIVRENPLVIDWKRAAIVGKVVTGIFVRADAALDLDSASAVILLRKDIVAVVLESALGKLRIGEDALNA